MAFSTDMEAKIVEIFQNNKVKNILHIGACLGEEKPFYETFNPEKIYWFEPNPNLISELSNKIKSEKYESILFPYAVGKENGSLPFNIIGDDRETNPGCSSLRNLKEHSKMYPNIKWKNSVMVDVVNIDSFITENNLVQEFDLVSLDTQGNDFDILSSSQFIFTARAIVIETSELELYDGQVVEKELTKFLESKGFIKEYYSKFHPSWGDTLYIKK
jgi:FkbM family methyltransferase